MEEVVEDIILVIDDVRVELLRDSVLQTADLLVALLMGFLFNSGYHTLFSLGYGACTEW